MTTTGIPANRCVPELLLAELPAVHLRHHEIEQDERGALAAAQAVEGDPSVLAEVRVVAFLREHLAERLPEIGVVVHDEDRAVGGHRRGAS